VFDSLNGIALRNLSFPFTKWRNLTKKTTQNTQSSQKRLVLHEMDKIQLQINQKQQKIKKIHVKNKNLENVIIEGKILSKHLNYLISQRNNMSATVSDKAEIINDLLTENQILTKRLKHA